MKNPLILTYDCGTQSIRAMLVDKTGKIVGQANKVCQQCFSLGRGYAEQYASVYENAIAEVSQELKNSKPDLWNDIVAVTSTSIRDTSVCMDKDGNVLRPIILWLDQRDAKCKSKLPILSRVAFKLVGMTETIKVQRKLCKSNWIKENEPEIWNNTYKYMMFSGFVTHRMTGKFIDSTACQAGHIPYHYKKRAWKSTKDIQFHVFSIEKDKLCELVEPGKILGNITKEFSDKTGVKVGLPVVATGSDKSCETLGSGVVDSDVVSLSFGTQATIQFLTEKYVEAETFLPTYTSVIPNRFNPEIQIYRGYWMVSWFKNEFAKYEIEEAEKKNVSVEGLLDAHLKEIQPGCEGLMLQPLWAPMLRNPEGRGTIIGFNHIHTKWHLYRAIIEGIGYALYDAFVKIQKRVKTTVKKLVVSGGGSQSDEICQMTADMFGLPVTRLQTCEACGLGSSIAGFVAINEFPSFYTAVDSMVHYQKTFLPNEKVHEFYKKIYNGVYKNLYKTLRPTYLNLKAIVWDEQ